MGTALTEEQVGELVAAAPRRWCWRSTPTAPGQEAMLRAQRVAGGGAAAAAGRARCRRAGPGRDDGRPRAGAERFRALLDARGRAARLPGRAGARAAPTPPRRPSATGRSTRSRRCSAAMGETTAARSWCGGSPSASTSSRRWCCGGRGGAPAERRPAAAERADAGPSGAARPRRAARGRADLARAARAGAAGDVHRAAGGGARVPRPAHRRAPLAAGRGARRDWLRDHLEDPAADLPRDDAELAGLVTELVISPSASRPRAEAMELNFLLLEQRRLEAEIAAAGERGRLRAPRRAEPRARGALVERIAHDRSGSRAESVQFGPSRSRVRGLLVPG